MSDRLSDKPVWDLPTRIFHWSLVLLVAFSLITGQFGEHLGIKVVTWHQFSGCAILALLIFRIFWGFFGGTHARFASFVRGPRTVLGYLRGLFSGRGSEAHAGHNPLGGWSVVAMLLCLALQACTGLFLSDDDLGFEGPLAKYISNHTGDQLKAVHEANAIVLVTLIVMHLSAIAYHFLVMGENLVRPMVTGRKPLAPGALPGEGGGVLKAMVILAAVAAAIWLVVTRA